MTGSVNMYIIIIVYCIGINHIRKRSHRHKAGGTNRLTLHYHNERSRYISYSLLVKIRTVMFTRILHFVQYLMISARSSELSMPEVH